MQNDRIFDIFFRKQQLSIRSSSISLGIVRLLLYFNQERTTCSNYLKFWFNKNSFFKWGQNVLIAEFSENLCVKNSYLYIKPVTSANHQGGNDCVGELFETTPCDGGKCPSWTQWSEYTTCSGKFSYHRSIYWVNLLVHFFSKNISLLRLLLSFVYRQTCRKTSLWKMRSKISSLYIIRSQCLLVYQWLK